RKVEPDSWILKRRWRSDALLPDPIAPILGSRSLPEVLRTHDPTDDDRRSGGGTRRGHRVGTITKLAALSVFGLQSSWKVRWACCLYQRRYPSVEGALVLNMRWFRRSSDISDETSEAVDSDGPPLLKVDPVGRAVKLARGPSEGPNFDGPGDFKDVPSEGM
ncbi:MAG: hypothetical protein ACRDJG_12845, partial [Actinomycetota bacterium]